MPRLAFYYEFASPYSYLTAARIEQLAKDRGIEVDWRPILLGPIFRRQGFESSPFVANQKKGAYMWRDVARIAANLGLPWKKPRIFPQHSLLASRIAFAGRKEPWIGAFTRAVFHMAFALDEDISKPELMIALLRELDLDADKIMRQAETTEVKIGLRAAVAEAEALGVFGAPSMITEKGELYWGNDRLDEALDASFVRIG
ncbi:DSBA oxidoreductase [Pseudovibrio sp. FO-BEG1]|uniref:2-hydroxychromene-2-carboxylate isomerase n=2 Tax=Pseudovibrio TaxID=258255 RepID=A0A1I7ALY3_9HYPH|nr:MULTISPECIES: 2-hydroxychromene-2-carboxylate isomerase [Pseudovibrio]AEV34707.1 DSBA oxidoreductase [Pseudovibrio sp. FO-BEG1]QUS55739.1 2-hydroxychromene-2-carboxylate isomerase [Pseudovibrio brasiliensis]SFT75950.1 2-hydroxychromene-2-carboxylate isomerase [Pseudovibrio denitrificans]